MENISAYFIVIVRTIVLRSRSTLNDACHIVGPQELKTVIGVDEAAVTSTTVF